MTDETVEECASEDGAALALTIGATKRRERVLLDSCSAGCLCPPRLVSGLLRHCRTSARKSATGGMVQMAGQQWITVRTIEDSVLVVHVFEVAKGIYQPDVLILVAGNLTSNVFRIAPHWQLR